MILTYVPNLVRRRKLMVPLTGVHLPRVGVGVIILRDKKVLLGLRKGTRGSGHYGLPGGFWEENESFEDCAEREVREETGLSDLSFIPIYLIGGASDNIQYADIIFYANYKNGEPRVMETHRAKEWGWFNVFDLPSDLYEPTRIALKHFVSNYRFHRLNFFVQSLFPQKKPFVLYIDSVEKRID